MDNYIKIDILPSDDDIIHIKYTGNLTLKVHDALNACNQFIKVLENQSAQAAIQKGFTGDPAQEDKFISFMESATINDIFI